ncbi:hypothetical protein [Streptomyces olivaceoviridis]|uniref:hypothetical protein n=1 Tax=Streptomyces olivaceoviridis TaxID=1921 RepID=UPI0036F6FB79
MRRTVAAVLITCFAAALTIAGPASSASAATTGRRQGHQGRHLVPERLCSRAPRQLQQLE